MVRARFAVRTKALSDTERALQTFESVCPHGKMVFRETRRRTAPFCHEGRWRSFKKCTHVCARWIACLRDDVLATFFGGGEAYHNVERLEPRTICAAWLLHVWRSTWCADSVPTCTESCLFQRVATRASACVKYVAVTA